jgi:hypothetical protein
VQRLSRKHRQRQEKTHFGAGKGNYALSLIGPSARKVGTDHGDREPRVHRGHVKYGEITPIIMSAVLGLLMAVIAYGRLVLQPII